MLNTQIFKSTSTKLAPFHRVNPSTVNLQQKNIYMTAGVNPGQPFLRQGLTRLEGWDPNVIYGISSV